MNDGGGEHESRTRIDGRVGRLRIALNVEQPVPEPAPPAEQESGWQFGWQTLLGIVGAAAAIGVWINVVGGAVLWARFDAAGLPASQVVGIVPNTTLLAIGIRALALPLFVGIVAVAVFYISTPPKPKSADPARHAAEPSRADSPELSIRGFGGVLVSLLALSLLTVFLLFGGDLAEPAHQEYLYAWALASLFLVPAAATYEPVNRFLKDKGSRDRALVALGAAGFALVCAIGLIAGYF
jgi:hypothetical protein